MLDFGLAKAAVGSWRDARCHPVTDGHRDATREGIILGTAAYMSPEQARGQAVDKRTDIWAFGGVLYEMLAGRPAFAGATVTDTLGAILEREPRWEALPKALPAAVHRLLRRCLEKDARLRLHDIADARIEIEEALTSESAGGPPEAVATHGRWWRGAAAIALAVLAGLGGWWLAHRSASPVRAAVVRLSIPSVDPLFILAFGVRHLAISEDGSRVAYASASRLLIRQLDRKDAVAIEIQAPTNPFFSPNGDWVAFSRPAMNQD